MGFLDKLSTLLKVDISKLKTIKLFSDNKKVEINVNFTGINPSLLTSKQQDELKKLLNDVVQIEDTVLIEEESNKLLEDFTKSDSEKRNKKILAFLRNKIPPEDVKALRASLYLRKLHEERTNRELIAKVKSDIIQKYGERGGNIANLCTAGYFESTIIPLYETMAKEAGFKQEKFITRYDAIVLQVPFAVFVSGQHTEASLKSEVLSKIETNKKYGIHKLNIHAIGIRNSSKIKKVIKEIEEHFTKTPELESGSGYYIITIWF